MTEKPLNIAIEELKHSVLTHVTLMGGPNAQLSAFLVKVIDFLEDPDTKHRDDEIMSLSYSITEAVAIFVQKSIDDRASKSEDFPPRISQAGNDLLVVIGKTRNHEDKVEAKNTVLRVIAHALRELSTFTKSSYPSITNCQKQIL